MASVDEIRAELEVLEAEILAIHKTEAGELRELTVPQQRRFDQLVAERAEQRERLAQHEAIARNAADPARVVGPNARSARKSTGDATRDAAMRVLDESVRSGFLPEQAAEKVDRLVNDGDDFSRSTAARWAIATGDPAYASAFAKIASDPERGHLLWDREEHAAYQGVNEVRTAMGLTDANGGYMVPLTLDPSVRLSSDGSINPLRRISNVVQTVTDQWQGVTSAGATAEWKAEGVEAADGAPTVDDAPIPVHFGDVYVPYSFEIGMDARRFLQELAKVMGDAADQLQATAFTTGSGSGQPKGFVTALAGTSSEINGGGTEALIAADAYTLQNALPPRFQANASWVANIATINTFAQFETTNGAIKFPEIANDRLLRKPLHELSNMDGSINAAATANNYLMAYGDFREAFTIVDRIGTTLEFLPMVIGTNRRPTGQRGAFLWFRTGSDVVVPQALRLLDVPTTA